MKSATNPSLNTLAASSSTPVSIASVVAASIARSASPPATVPTAAPVSAASVDVVETDSARELPTSAYANIGTSAVQSPTSTGSPAIVAYAIAWGMTTAAVVTPATASCLLNFIESRSSVQRG